MIHFGGFGRTRSRHFEHKYLVKFYGTDYDPAFGINHPEGANDGSPGGNVLLPQSALHRLTEMETVYPMLFELLNPRTQRRIHMGVLEFTAEEGVVYLPYWMETLLDFRERDSVIVKSVSLPLGRLVKLRPHKNAFWDLTNPHAVLEKKLRKFTALTLNTTVRIHYNSIAFDFDVTHVAPESQGAICILNADVNTEFDPPLDLPAEQPKPAAAQQQQQQQHLPHAELDVDSDDEADDDDTSSGFKAFSGSGQKLKSGAKSASTTTTTGGDGSNEQQQQQPSRQKPALRWKLKFQRFGGVQPELPKAKTTEEDTTSNKFVPFQGDGTSLKKSKPKK